MPCSSSPFTLAAERSPSAPRWTERRSACVCVRGDSKCTTGRRKKKGPNRPPPSPPQVPHYSLTVQAADEGDPPLSSAVLIAISVADVNDNAPVFSRVNHSLLLQVGQEQAHYSRLHRGTADPMARCTSRLVKQLLSSSSCVCVKAGLLILNKNEFRGFAEVDAVKISPRSPVSFSVFYQFLPPNPSNGG